MSNYSMVERWMHRMVFSLPMLSDTLKELESSLYGSRWQNQRVTQPIFIAALPRAGTTLVLELLGRHPDTVSYSYRDMPFVQSPVIWHRASRWFIRPETKQERMHGDGVAIGFDSLEAFEEVIWRQAFPDHYQDDRILLWEEGRDAADSGLTDQIRKLLWLRQGRRYLSKNNANVARLAAIRREFPDARVVVPFRHPLEHAISMQRQHQRFLTLHDADRFNRDYMAYIGHFEFGHLHRPVAFPGFIEMSQGLGPDSLAYWLAYWLAAYRHLAAQPQTAFLHYEGLCGAGEAGLARLTDTLGLTASSQWHRLAAAQLRPPPTSRYEGQVLPKAWIEEASALYQALEARCLLTP
ncbi:sulfotransferase [Ferrimonas balearica]|uniref:sulfotransferase n=1 Tax=Ferrimonas balearica TaxID=44012 RepID=UPI001C99A39C|nr:sulfotransferase [Ferrimonas balearica]MBY5992049.1 sulfotransferase [Ferrimonas balearica]